MVKLEHDPRTKQQIKEIIYSFLYAPITHQFKSRLNTLIERNTITGRYSHRHFVYRGILYNGESTYPPLKRNRLLTQLRQPMDVYLAELSKLNNQELPYVLGFINQVLNASSDITDYLRVLPESVHYPLTQLLSTCPCRATTLSEDKVTQLKIKNQEPINLMKQRLVTNLLI